MGDDLFVPEGAIFGDALLGCVIDPDNAKAQNNMGVVLRELGRLDDAVAAYNRAIELDPGDARAHYNLGLALDDLGLHRQARAARKRAEYFDPTIGD